MDHRLKRLPDSYLNRLDPENEVIFSTIQQPLDIADVHKDAPSITQFPNLGTYSPTLDTDSVHKYLSQFLLEEESIDGNNLNIFFDPIALSATENSFYEALYDNPSSPVHSNAGSSRYGVERIDLHNSDILSIVDPRESESSVACRHPDTPVKSSSQANSDGLNSSLYTFDSELFSQMDAFLSANSVSKVFFNDDAEAILQFKRGVDDANRFLHANKHLVINLNNYLVTPDLYNGKKHYHSDKSGSEEESRSKHCAVYEDIELSEVFDKVLLCSDDNDCLPRVGTQQNTRSGHKRHLKKGRDSGEFVDLESLLVSCARSVADADYRAAKDKLQKIRQHSSPTGDANQRLANYFADGLEARLAGSGTQLYVALTPNNTIIAEMLKSYMSSWPWMRLSIFFANRMIYEVASNGASLHVIDFGILYGIQWPTLIRDLSQRPGGPPKLRITGIELPQPGFRPSQMVDETGRRLAKYCEHFNVPFEYNAITKMNWERIKIDELKLVSGEVVAVNSLVRFHHLLDETAVGADSPRDAVLKLIREVNPHIYAQTVCSGPQNSPFFVTRFREALLFYTAIFDLLDATLPRHDNQRLNLEKEFMGGEIMNIVACEGKERLQRTETCKQWQSRIMRAGFKPMAVNPRLAKKLRYEAREGYDKDFLFLEDGNWIIQGWKGRIIGGSSCWVA
ncbi:unnamed protein product [Cuscuta epithymum]|uniref:Scarecrow-like protein 14 n=2 Tax=Cuscuta epithymum TaxID=186058 RepID=A0AAV0GA55_9ASTE|nr:unnamed protein product [Cuscuta epithymum]